MRLQRRLLRGRFSVANPGSEYEDLLRSIVSVLAANCRVETLELKVRHAIPGKTLDHEADVWWRFRRGTKERSVWISCKDWAESNRVSNEDMAAFAWKRADALGEPHGVFVVRHELQSGALKVAAAEGITVLKIRKPTDKDWEGRVQKIHLTMNAQVPQIEVEFSFASSAGSSEEEGTVMYVHADEVTLVHDDGATDQLARLIERSLNPPPLKEESDWAVTTTNFDPPVVARLSTGDVGPIEAVHVRQRWTHITRESVMDGSETVELIVADALGEDISLLDAELSTLPGGDAGGTLGRILDDAVNSRDQTVTTDDENARNPDHPG